MFGFKEGPPAAAGGGSPGVKPAFSYGATQANRERMADVITRGVTKLTDAFDGAALADALKSEFSAPLWQWLAEVPMVTLGLSLAGALKAKKGGEDENGMGRSGGSGSGVGGSNHQRSGGGEQQQGAEEWLQRADPKHGAGDRRGGGDPREQQQHDDDGHVRGGGLGAPAEVRQVRPAEVEVVQFARPKPNIG